jgi:hypothetical protein
VRRPATIAVGAALLIGACGDQDTATAPLPPERVHTTPEKPRERPPLAQARCPAAAPNCASATGRVIYVEKVDPDGDGDAHFVLAGGSVTGPGLSVIDVARAMRPDPLPRAGDLVTASGPVYRGSHGQRQIEARELRVRRLR